MATLTSEEIKQLMVKAREMGAQSFSYGDLQVEFGPAEADKTKETVNPETGLTPKEEADWFASSEG